MYEPFGQPRFNAFQRLNEAKQLWSDAIHITFDSWLTDAELIQLERLYQKRHLLAHREGIVDSKYIEKTNDNSYKVGQRITIIPKDIDFLLYVLDKLANGIKLACGNCDN
jgi:hypothetical protein